MPCSAGLHPRLYSSARYRKAGQLALLDLTCILSTSATGPLPPALRRRGDIDAGRPTEDVKQRRSPAPGGGHRWPLRATTVPVGSPHPRAQEDDAAAGEEESRVDDERGEEDAAADEEEAAAAAGGEETADAGSWRRRSPELEEEAESRQGRGGTSTSTMGSPRNKHLRHGGRRRRSSTGVRPGAGSRAAARGKGRGARREERRWRQACGAVGEEFGCGSAVARRRPLRLPRRTSTSSRPDVGSGGGRWFAYDDRGATAADGCGSMIGKGHLTGGPYLFRGRFKGCAVRKGAKG
jgi:hypothetical protein